GIAYAVASGVPGIYGLYATIVPLLAYAVFGPSRILVLGPDSALAALILAVVLQQSGGDPMRAVALAGAMAVVSGLACILFGLLRLGFVTELLSKPIRYGYMNGIALTVLISQLPKLFGFSIEDGGPLLDLWAIGVAIGEGRTNWTTFLLGAGTLPIILLLEGHKRIPGILVAVITATLVVGALDLGENAGVAVLGALPQAGPQRIRGILVAVMAAALHVGALHLGENAGVAVRGALPQGLPAFAIPWITWADVSAVVSGGLAVALVSFADSSVLSRVYA